MIPDLPAPAAARSYEAVLRTVEADLRSGKLTVGGRLPGERMLAQSHGISRASVRDAIRVLEAMGVVRTSVGSGPNSGAIVVANAAAGMGTTLRLHMATRMFPVDDIIATRILMETWATQEAAEREHPAEALARAEALLARMDDPGMDRETFHALDAQFHVLLSSLSGNAVITAMMESLRLAVQDYVSESIDDEATWAAIVPGLRVQHHGIMDAVFKHDGGAAAERLRHHIRWFDEQTRRARTLRAQARRAEHGGAAHGAVPQ
ncbi:FadR/GntR family transcriptional regulator [Specibacter cremeus]|uniref:FadR/GntR family transcriptional regulator n=1 Tax=Specibacter cremeus TaxID=1629051 RepID=UPI001F0C770E|nr:FCD domain-containing protein [Specibacter cremeus]